MHDSYSDKFFFFSSTRSVHFFQHHQLELRTSKTSSKRQNLVQNKNIDVQNLENRIPFGVFHSDFFRHCATFFEFFLDSTKGSPLRLFRYFATQMDVKNPKESPFHIFRHCGTSKISLKKLFGKHTEDPLFGVLHSDFFRLCATFFEIFWIAPKVLSSFVSIFRNTRNVKKSQRVPLLHFLAL